MILKKVKMTKTERGSQNGFKVETFYAGNEYVINDELAEVFVKQLKVAQYVSEIVSAPNKQVEIIPEVKEEKNYKKEKGYLGK